MPEQWQAVLFSHQRDLTKIEDELNKRVDVIPERKMIFRALPKQISDCKVLIVGQDPYPQRENANGLAFSVAAQTSPLPASLRNIFLELQSDLNGPLRVNGDLSDWANQGVVLLNRILTTQVGLRAAHIDMGWQQLTWKIASVLAEAGVPALLWGKSASDMSVLFDSEQFLASAHPSPLSAYRGFFGSRPFSWVNSRLEGKKQSRINWG